MVTDQVQGPPSSSTPLERDARLVSTDHKVAAIRLLAHSFFFFLLSGLLALVMRTELARPGMLVEMDVTAATAK